MRTRTYRWALIAGCIGLVSVPLQAQVFVVGEKTATADISTDFTPTNLSLPTDRMTERGRRELVRNLEAEQGFAHRSLPRGSGVTLHANGTLSPNPEEYRRMVYQKGEAAAPGDRVVITAMEIKGDRIILDLNGGPYAKHRFLSHIQLNDNPVVAAPAEQPTGARVTLVFAGFVPEISAPEVKALLVPVIDFGVKSSEQAYADTLPSKLRDAISAHEVLVGMNHRMVLAALGAPDSKLREQQSGDPNGARYEEWIYGHVPQTVRFVRFVGDRVTVVEIAVLGKPVEIHDKDEMGGSRDPADTREIAMGDKKPDGQGTAAAPSLRLPGEAAPANSQGNVQYPKDNRPVPPPPGSSSDPSVGTSSDPSSPSADGPKAGRPSITSGRLPGPAPYPTNLR
ncbi:hypothetical protein [Edaphobacter bradus]|uniref:hypothetical protein n=1 Tax=Edaphobacter bradus TaxID=2259016 RepID=UPI0021DFB3FC|nr:hypothetical protein [Edaphobacter bradus]